MPVTSLRVSMLSVTPNAEALVYAAFRQCYSAHSADELFRDAKTDYLTAIGRKKMDEFIHEKTDSGHTSVIEHVSLSFAVCGVSRALSHQLVRHRIASYSQQSQRYVKADGFDYVRPESIRPLDSKYIRIPVPGGGVEYLNANAVFKEAMDCCQLAYNRLIELGVPAEDARFVLPNACETKLVVTMNARSLLHFFEQRCCQRAQWEIRALASEMLRLCKGAVPVLFETAGARCERMGFCEEEKGCGRAPRLKDVMEKYKYKEDAPCV